MNNLSNFINQQENNLTYREIYRILKQEEKNVITDNADSLDLLLHITAFDFDPANLSYPFSAKIEKNTHVELISQLRGTIEHPDTAWLLHDVFWTNNRKNPEYAGLAAEYACKSAHALDQEKFSLEILHRMRRALILSGQSQNGEIKKNIRKELEILTKKSLSIPTSFLPVWLLNLLIEIDEKQILLEMVNSTQIVKSAEIAESSRDWELSHKLRQAHVDILRLNKQEERSQTALIELAQSFNREAKVCGNGIKATLTYQKSIRILQQVNLPTLHNQRDALEEEFQIFLQESQLKMIGELVSVQSGQVNLSTPLTDLEAVLSQANSFEEGLFILSARYPLHNELEMQTRISSHVQSLVHSLFAAAQIVDEKGRTLDQPMSLEEKVSQKITQELSIGWHLTGALIEHGRRCLSARYSVCETDWMEILCANPFIPNGHHEILAKGLHQGFNSEWLISTHLLPPQFEASMKYMLESNFKVAQKVTPTMKQKDFLLKELIDHPTIKNLVNSDFCFELNRLLTEDGLNLRNNGFHGKMNFIEFYTTKSVYLWYLSLKFFCFAPTLLRPIKKS